MRIELYQDFKKRVNSTKQPIRSDAEEIDVVLKVPTSIDKPTFILHRHKQLADYDNRNCYVYVPVWNRYYFADNIVYTNNDIFELQCSSDVLATYKNTISQYECFIERSTDGNEAFNDPLVSPTQIARRKKSQTTALSLTYNNGCYGVRIAGAGDSGVITYIFQDLSMLAQIFDKSKYNIVEEWEEMVANYIFDPFDYVLDLFFIPISYSTLSSNSYTEEKRFRIKWFDLGYNVRAVKQGAVYAYGANNINLPNNVYTDFRKYNPAFSQYTISIPAVGTMQLDNNIVEGLDVRYVTKLDTGSTKVWLQDTETGVEYSSYTTDIYTHIQFASANADLTSVAGSVLGSIGSVMTHNPLAIASSLVSGVSNIFNPPPSVVGSNGDIGLIYSTNIKVSLINFDSGEYPYTVCGYTTYENRRIGDMTGFIKCGNASIPLVGLTGDRDRVNAYLNSGFYFE